MSMPGCPVCEFAATNGWTGASHCGGETGCHRDWTSKVEAHCVRCHRHFPGPADFDAHSCRSEP